MAGLFAVTLAIYGLAAAVPLLMQQAVDRIIEGTATLATMWLAGAALASVVVEAWLGWQRQGFVRRLLEIFDRRMFRKLAGHLLRARLDGERLSTGETVNRFYQIQRIRSFLLFSVPSMSLDIGSAIVSVAIMAWYDWPITLLTLVVTGGFALLMNGQRLRTIAAARAQQAAEEQRTIAITETVGGLSTIKAQAMENSRFGRWSILTDKSIQATASLLTLSSNFAVGGQAAARTLTVLVLCAGCYRVFQGALTVGELLALQLLAARVMAPVSSLSNVYTQYQEASVALANLSGLLAAPLEAAGRKPALKELGEGGFAARGVGLRYANNPTPALEDVEFSLPPRGVFAIVGRNGSGKSSLVRSLLGLQRNFAGTVQVGGHDVLDYAPRWLRGQFGVVDQDSTLFTGTVRDNVCRGLPADDDAVRRALADAGALSFVLALPERLDTVIQERSRNLSGGQRQRLIIARALYGDPKFLILDEPTAFLDPEAAVALERRLAALGRDRLVLLVSHHLTATAGAERILVMDSGRLIAQGAHAALLKDCPHYASLWDDYNRNQPGAAA